MTASEDGIGGDTPATYWADSEAACADDGVLHGDHVAEVAVIGAGYTGLSAAYHIAARGGGRPVVLESRHAGHGCSGRNGGLVRPALGRVPYTRWVRRWGRDRARSLAGDALEAVALTRRLATAGDIECERTPPGVLKVAHAPSALQALEREASALHEDLGIEAELLDGATVSNQYLRSRESYGALRLPQAFSLNPLRYAHQLLRLARSHGAAVHREGAVVDWRKSDGVHVLTTPDATIRARQVIVATNGYGTEQLCRKFRGALMPMLSNIIVTRPLTEQERGNAGLLTTQAAFDTRRLLNYYRLLPDGRVLFGSRGPLRESSRSRRHHRARLHASMAGKFPALRGVDIEHYWNGWVALPYDFTPHVGSNPSDPTVLFGLGYSGSGVAAATYAGKLLADRVTTAAEPHPVLGTAPPPYPMPGLRGLAQAVAVGWFQWLDDGKPW